MTWVRKDDQMPIHRKVAPLSDAAYRLYDEALHWSARNLTDGAIGESDLKEASKRGQPRYAADLVARRLWHPAGEECPSPKCPPSDPDGWVIHDYWDYQPSREAVLKERAAAAERQRRRRAKDGRFADDESGHAVTHAVVTDSVTRESRPPRPVPVPKGREGPTTNSQGDVRNGRDPEPPRTCPKHLDDPDPPPCGPCADARRQHGRWEAARNARQAAAPKCRTHRGQPAHNCALCAADRKAAPDPEGATA